MAVTPKRGPHYCGKCKREAKYHTILMKKPHGFVYNG